MAAICALVAITNGAEFLEAIMQNKNVEKALELLLSAHSLLKTSECENLKKSTGYLKESIQHLKKHKPGSGANTH